MQEWPARPPVQFVLDSFDDFVEFGMQACVNALPPLTITRGDASARIKLGRVFVWPQEEAPRECRLSMLTYKSLVRVEVLLNNEKPRLEFLCNLPMMLGSRFSKPLEERDHGGYMIIKGRERVFVGLEQQRTNAPLYLDGKTLTAVIASEHSPARLLLEFAKNGAVTAKMNGYMSAAMDAEVLAGMLDGEPGEIPLEPWAPSQDEFMRSVLLPHLSKMEKSYWLRLWVRDIRAVKAGEKPPTDRDSLSEKRVRLCGDHMEELFRSALGGYWRMVEQGLNKQSKKEIDVFACMRHANTRISGHLSSAIATGDWGKGKVGVTRSMERDHVEVAQISCPRRTHAALPSTSKKIEPRHLHGSQYGFICPAETPGSENIGYTKNPAFTTEISTNGDIAYWRKVLRGFHANELVEAAKEGRAIVLNGSLGASFDCTLAEARETLEAAIQGDPPGFATVHACEQGLYVDTTSGRYIRPLVRLDAGGTPRERVMVDARMDEWIVSACTPNDIVPGVSTHLELHPSFMLGFSAGLIPYAEHDCAPRLTFQAEMGKQALGVNTLEHRRWDPTYHRMDYPQAPLCSTMMERKLDLLPSSANAICFVYADAFGQEDSLVMSQRALDLGFMRTIAFRTMSETCKPPWRFEKYDTGHIKLDDDGCPMPGTRLIEHDTMFSMVHPDGHCRAVLYHEQYPGIVEACYRSINEDGHCLVQVMMRYARQIEVGDKFASRHGQKGSLGAIYQPEDLPFTGSGMIPDIMINPNAFPSRMTIAHMVEMLRGKRGAIEGHLEDATPFQGPDRMEAVEACLHELGWQKRGHEVVYSGTTGEMLPGTVFAGPIAYQRLRHLVADKMNARGRGKNDVITRQPVQGRSRHGGLRLGEMEVWALAAHGASGVIHERMLISSDGTKIHICLECGSLARPPVCEMASCNGTMGFEERFVPYAMMLLMNELRGSGIEMKLTTKDGPKAARGTLDQAAESGEGRKRPLPGMQLRPGDDCT
jgi:DNA-directed RNA polymerase beta subunit